MWCKLPLTTSTIQSLYKDNKKVQIYDKNTLITYKTGSCSNALNSSEKWNFDNNHVRSHDFDSSNNNNSSSSSNNNNNITLQILVESNSIDTLANDIQNIPGVILQFPSRTSDNKEIGIVLVQVMQNKITGSFSPSSSSSLQTLSDIVSHITNFPEVLFVSERPTFVLHNKWVSHVIETSSSAVQYPLLSAIPTLGQNEVIGIADTGVDRNSCFFAGEKIIDYIDYADDADDDGHGTHVASTAAGNDQSTSGYAAFNGVCSLCSIAVFDIGNSDGSIVLPGDLEEEMFLPLYESGSRIFSNSWGSYNSRGSYTTDSLAVDRFMNKYPDAIILFSAGNEGYSGYQTISSLATAKNCITVGASLNSRDSFESLYGWSTSDLNPNNLASFSSRGPTADGRMKPDIVAPGWWVVSAASGEQCSLEVMRGTSMATPAMAGGAALVRSFFVNGYYPTFTAVPQHAFNPSGALIKAILIHSAQPLYAEVDDYWNVKKLDGVVPGHDCGYGRVELTKLLCLDSDNQCTNSGLWLTGSAFANCDDYSHDTCRENDNSQRGIYHEIQSEGQTVQFSFPTINDDTTSDMKATLVWTDDVYSTSKYGGLLVNSLDMTLLEEFSNGTQRLYEPLQYTLGYTPSTTQTIIHTPIVGAKYQLFVTGTMIVSAQPFAVVVSGFNGTLVTDQMTSTTSAWGAMSGNFLMKLHEIWEIYRHEPPQVQFEQFCTVVVVILISCGLIYYIIYFLNLAIIRCCCSRERYLLALEKQPNFPWGAPVNVNRIKRYNDNRIENYIEEYTNRRIDSSSGSINSRFSRTRGSGSGAISISSSHSGSDYIPTLSHDNDEISSPIVDIESTAPPFAYAEVIASPVNPVYKDHRT